MDWSTYSACHHQHYLSCLYVNDTRLYGKRGKMSENNRRYFSLSMVADFAVASTNQIELLRRSWGYGDWNINTINFCFSIWLVECWFIYLSCSLLLVSKTQFKIIYRKPWINWHCTIAYSCYCNRNKILIVSAYNDYIKRLSQVYNISGIILTFWRLSPIVYWNSNSANC